MKEIRINEFDYMMLVTNKEFNYYTYLKSKGFDTNLPIYCFHDYNGEYVARQNISWNDVLKVLEFYADETKYHYTKKDHPETRLAKDNGELARSLLLELGKRM